MAKKIIIIFLMIGCLSLNVSSAFFEQVNNPPNMFMGYASTEKTEGLFSVYEWNIRQYFWDQEPKISPPITQFWSYRPIIGIWNSYNLAETLYKFSMNIEIENVDNDTGYLDTNDVGIYLFPSEFIGPIDVTTNETQYIETGYDGTEYSDYEITDARVFYDSTSKTMSVIYYVDRNKVSLDSYLCVMLPTTENLNTVAYMKVTTYTGTQPIDNYTNILNDISNKLDQIASSSGGLTEEQINQAIQDALTAHDQQLEQEADGKLEQILEQINGIVSPYSDAADQINNAFDGLSDVFASTSTSSVFKFPEGRMPNGMILWQEHNIDIGAAWLRIPAKFRAVVQIVCTFTILYAVIQEAIFVIRFIILGRRGTEDD